MLLKLGESLKLCLKPTSLTTDSLLSGSDRKWAMNVLPCQVHTLLDNYNCEWLNAISTSCRFTFCLSFKSNLLPEQLFNCTAFKRYQHAPIRFRLGVLPGKSSMKTREKKLCGFRLTRVRWDFFYMSPLYQSVRS